MPLSGSCHVTEILDFIFIVQKYLVIYSIIMTPFQYYSRPADSSLTTMEDFSATFIADCSWIPDDTSDTWIKRFTVTLLSFGCGCPVLNATKPICLLDSSFCRIILRNILHAVLEADPQERRQELSILINRVLDLCMKEGAAGSKSERLKVVNDILDCVQFLLYQKPSRSFTPGLPRPTWHDSHCWLSLDRCTVAAAALWAGRHYLALTQLEEHVPVTTESRSLLVQVRTRVLDLVWRGCLRIFSV